MRPVRAISLYLVFIFLGGALIAPWVYSFVHAAAAILPLAGGVVSKPFPRFLNRSLLILALVGLWPFLRAADLRSWRAIGLGRRPDALRRVLAGFVLGLASLACVVFVVLAMGARQPDPAHGFLALIGHSVKASVAAAAAATLEEVFFRGALFGTLRKTFFWPLALVLSSAVYALVHFLERAEVAGPVTWASGFVVLGSMVKGFADMEKMIPGFLNLTLAGVILGLAYERTGSLHFSIGLHAGWIFWLKTYGFATVGAAGMDRLWFFGTGKLINGWLAFVVLALLLGILSRWLVQQDSLMGWKEKRLFS